MVVRFLLFSLFLLLSACLSGSDSSQANSPITYTITSLGSERYQVAFKANISGEHSGYWQFGDGYVSVGRSVNHIYYSPGQYTITYSYEQNGQQQTLKDTLVLEGATQNLDVISRQLITIDSDHNDPNQTWKSNDLQPQAISVPSTISGIMMAKGSCQTGRLCARGDDIDHYEIHSESPFVVTIDSYEGELKTRVDNEPISLEEQNRFELNPGKHLISLVRVGERVRYTMNLSTNAAVDASAYQPGKLIIQYHNEHPPELVDLSDPRLRQYSNLQQARANLQQQDDIKAVSYNYWRFARSQYQWSLNEFDIPLLWQQLPNKGAGVRVAVIDTGLLNHSELNSSLMKEGFDFVSDPLQSDDGDGWDANPFDASGSGHGTHVTGIIAGQGQLNHSGVAGISPRVEIMPLRAIGRFGATSYDLIQSLLYAAGLDNDSGQRPSRPADIINLSLGGNNYSQMERDVINRVNAVGAIVVAASGNQGSNTVEYPAAYANVLSVGAHDRHGNVADYSNNGNALDVIAPGGSCSDTPCSDGIISLSDNGYERLSGTSMATAHASGVLANLKSHRKDLDGRDLHQLIEQGQLTKQSEHQFDSGWGRIDINKLSALAAEPSFDKTRLWLPAETRFQTTEQTIKIPLIARGQAQPSDLDIQILPASLNAKITHFSDYIYQIELTVKEDMDSVSVHYFDGQNWQSLKSKLIQHSRGYHVDFLDHLYVQLDSQRTPLRAPLNQTGWMLQYPQTATSQSIQVSSDIDYDGIYCEVGEFCGQRYQCPANMARSRSQCDSDKTIISPLSGLLIK